MRRLTGSIRDYAWGTTDVIPHILGTPATGEPQAEYWLGAHPLDPSDADGTPLDQVIESSPQIVGQASLHLFGPRLPYLMKILSAASALSLQVHPSRAQAEEGFERENDAGIPVDAPERSYRDNWPKPEILVALDEFAALSGFRDPLITYDLFNSLNVSGDLASVIGPLRFRSGAAGLAEVFLECLTSKDSLSGIVSEVVAAALHHTEEPGEFGDFCRTAVLLDSQHPADPAILAALLMNQVTLKPWEAIFQPAGLMHAYLHGTGIEVLANSDNVIRGGLTSKLIDVDELVRIVDFSSAPVNVMVADQTAPGVFHYPACTDEFDVWRFDLSHVDTCEIPRPDAGRIILVIDGEMTLTSSCTTGSGSTMTLTKGESAFLDAGLQVEGTGTAVATMSASGAYAKA